MKTITYIAVLFFISTVAFAQQKQQKFSENFKVDREVVIDLDTRYTDVIFETWNKNEVEVTAYMESDKLASKELKEAVERWGVKVTADKNSVRILSKEGFSGTMVNIEGLEDLDVHLEGIEEIVGSAVSVVEPVMKGLIGPLLEGITGTPLPAEYYESMDKIEFDHDAYRKEGKAYLDRYEKQVKKQFGPDFDKKMERWEEESERNMKHWTAGFTKGLKGIPRWPYSDDGNMNFDSDAYEQDKKAYVARLNKKYGTRVSIKETDRWLAEMEAWSERFEDEMEEWGEDLEENMEAWGEQFGKKMEAWGENFGKSFEKAFENWGENFGEDMEEWGENFGKKMEKWAEAHEGEWEEQYTEDENGNRSRKVQFNFDTDRSSKNTKRTILIKMPEDAEVKVNVRYGKIKMASAMNPTIRLEHGSLIASTIDGGETSIDVSYSPVTVSNWMNGALTANHVSKCNLNNVKNIALNSNSSNVRISKINGASMISGTFGELSIAKVSDDFGNLTIALDNSDLILTLPEAAFNFSMSGERNDVFLPEQLQTQSMKNGRNEMIHGFHKTRSTNNMITITAKFSDVVLN